MTDTYKKEIDDKELESRVSMIECMASGLETTINAIGKTRETSLALTNLELAVMWAVKAIYIEADK